MKLIDNISQAPKMWSIRLPALAATISTAWISVPPEVQALVPPHWVAIATAVLAVAAIIGRVVDQGLSKQP